MAGDGRVRGGRWVEEGKGGKGNAMLVRVGDKCPWGSLRRFGTAGKCRGVRTLSEREHFRRKSQVKQEEARTSCPFCVRGCCRFGEGCWRGVREDSDYSGSEDEELRQEDTGGQRRQPGEIRCEECTAGDGSGALEKGEVEYRHGVRKFERHEDEDNGWVYIAERVTTYEVAPKVETLGTCEELVKGGYYVALEVPENDETAVQEQPGLDVEALLRQAEMEQSCRLQEWSQWTFWCRDGGSEVGVQKAGRRKGRRVRVRKRWARTSRCLSRAAARRM